MAFINEEISVSEKGSIDWSQFKPWPSSEPVEPMWWTIDRDKDVFLVMLEGRRAERESPDVFALSWKGNFIRFEVDVSTRGTAHDAIVLWKLLLIQIPSRLENLRSAILEDLKEAIDANGMLFSREGIRSVQIELP